MPDSDSPTPNQSRQDQGKFDQDQINFLKTFLDAYKACGEELAMKGSGAKGLKGVKDNKKEWVLKKVYPAYVEHFDATSVEGLNLQSLKEVSGPQFYAIIYLSLVSIENVLVVYSVAEVRFSPVLRHFL